MILFGSWGMYYAYSVRQQAITEKATHAAELLSFTVGFSFLFMVGLGSWMFHMTLLYKYQLLDELPMILGSLVFGYIVMDLHPPTECYLGTGAGERKPSVYVIQLFNRFMIENRPFRAILLTGYGIATTVLMALDTSNPLPMNMSYSGLILFITWRCTYIFRSCVTDSYAQRTVRHYFTLAIIFKIAASVCWLIEKYLCGTLYPLTAYLHAFWHILAGTGVYLFIVWTFFLAVYNQGLSPVIKHFCRVPYVSIQRKVKR